MRFYSVSADAQCHLSSQITALCYATKTVYQAVCAEHWAHMTLKVQIWEFYAFVVVSEGPVRADLQKWPQLHWLNVVTLHSSDGLVYLGSSNDPQTAL